MKPYKVSSLEHLSDESKYIVRWEFEIEQQAIDFIKALIPEVVEVLVKKNGEITSSICRITTEKDRNIDIRPLDMANFYNVSSAWAWLSNLRLNGEVVSRPMHSGSKLSQYIVEPFISSENVEITQLQEN